MEVRQPAALYGAITHARLYRPSVLHVEFVLGRAAQNRAIRVDNGTGGSQIAWAAHIQKR